MSDKRPDLLELTAVWARVGIMSFGGPAAQIALMHRIVVEEKAWLDEKQFLNALNFCMLLPGPEAMQLATYSGWRIRGTIGGLIAGLLFVLPGALVMLALAMAYTSFGEVPFVQALFLGIKAAVIVIVIEALIKVSRRALKTRVSYVIAFLAFVSIFALAIPFPFIVLLAGLYGFFRYAPEHIDEVSNAPRPSVSASSTLRTISIWVGLWVLPFLVLWLFQADTILSEIASFFSTLAVVTFGGAYAVLAYMAQDVVTTNGWLSAEEMVDGLGLAETTPGPLILVTQFVGYLAAEKSGGVWLGIAGAAVTVWVTFVPCFLWIFAGAPYIDRLSTLPRLSNALSAITAAVVGVILNLSLWFAFHVFFFDTQVLAFGPFSMTMPEWASLDWRVLVLSILSGILLLGLKQNLLLALSVSAVGGVMLSAF